MAISAKALFEGIYKVQQEQSTNQRTRTGNKYHSGYRSSTKKKKKKKKSYNTHNNRRKEKKYVYTLSYNLTIHSDRRQGH